MSVAAAAPAPLSFAGLPIRSWLFAFRIWAAIMVALYAAFWLQIEGAASAATCVAILAQQTRGQAYQKAFYRFMGTVIGAAGAMAITGLFSQARDLFVLAFAAWMALSVFLAGLLDGNRAYGAQLSGYTVAIVAVQLIDTPQKVFLASVNRSAAIVIGIVALALVNDLLAAPDVRESVTRRLQALRAQVRNFASSASPGEPEADRDGTAARLLAAIAALHSDITAIASESIGGGARGAAARRAAFALIRAIFTVRRGTIEPDGRADATREADDAVARALADLETGRGDDRPLPLPIFRSRARATRNALRTFVVLILSGLLFVASGWPSTSLAFALVAITMALSSTAPKPAAFALAAAVAMPLAIAAVGVTEFLILDGVSEFPLLAIAMAPTVAIGCLMIATGKPPLAPIGLLLVVFFTVFLGPANPQDYNAQTYLVGAALAFSSVAVLFVGLTTILPANDRRTRRSLLGSARRELLAVLQGRRHRSAADLARDADRIAQATALKVGGTGQRDLAALFWMADMAEAAGGIFAALDSAGHSVEPAIRTGLCTLDAPLLRGCADDAAGHAIAPALVRAAQMIEMRPAGIETFLRTEAA